MSAGFQPAFDESGATSAFPEPVVTPATDKFMLACPECGGYGTHTGTCSWSFARRGEIWSFYAEKVTIRV